MPEGQPEGTGPAAATDACLVVAARPKPTTPAPRYATSPPAGAPAAPFAKMPPVTLKGSSAQQAVPAPAPTAAQSTTPRTPNGTVGCNMVPPATHIPARPLVSLQPAALEHVPAEPRSKAGALMYAFVCLPSAPEHVRFASAFSHPNLDHPSSYSSLKLCGKWYVPWKVQ